jgi:hypothetical protein
MTDTPQVDRLGAESLWSAMLSLAEAINALKVARDITVAGFGNSMAAASTALLYEAAGGLLREQGALFRSLAAGDGEAASFVRAVLQKLNGSRHRPTHARNGTAVDGPPDGAAARAGQRE